MAVQDMANLLMRSQQGLPASPAPVVPSVQLPLHGPQLLMLPQPVQYPAILGGPLVHAKKVHRGSARAGRQLTAPRFAWPHTSQFYSIRSVVLAP